MRFIIPTLVLAVVPGFSAAPPEHSLPLFFFPNTGQTDSSVQYVAQTPELSARFRPDSVIFQVYDEQVGVRFKGANPRVDIEARELLEAKVNFFIGNSNWKKDVPLYAKIVYRDLYPGIDMTYRGTGRQVKSEFVVAAGANPDLIRLEYSEPVAIDHEGNLISSGERNAFREDAPEIYQQLGTARVKVAGRYRLLDTHTVAFEIGRYDSTAPLVIDPTISYCSLLGGSGATAITGVAVDSSSNLYVTGWTDALNFPIAGAVQAANQGGVDVVVAKLNSAGTALLYATYIGGRSSDKGAAIAVDNFGQAYVTGSTSSSNFPLVLSNRPALGGSTAAFALKLNATGNTLLYSGYLGGTNYETGNAIAVDANSNAYIAGDTLSANFPRVNPTQPVIGGGFDAFVTKLNPTGAITFSTFLGGSGNEHAAGIAVDSLGDIYIAGGTSSPNFPVVSPFQSALKGGQDAFVTKIGFAGTVAFSTYLGGSGGSIEQANAIAVDSAGNAYVTGVTNSTNFPITSGAFQTALSGLQNAFVTRITSNGQALAYSTYLGGASTDWASGIAVSAAGNAYVSGYTSSGNFPQANAVQPAFNGLYDAFISEFNFAGNGLIFSTYYGGSGSDSANTIALDTNANIFVGGETSSTDLHLVTPIQSANAGSSTGWVLRLGVTALPPTTPSVTSVSPTSGSGTSVTFTAHYADTSGGSTISTAALLVNTSASTGFGCYVSYSPSLNLFSIYTDAGTSVLSTVVPGGIGAQNDQCALNGVGSSAVASGTTLTVSFSLTFQPVFPGSKTVYLLAADATSNTGWLAEGSFTVLIPVGQPTVDSVSPNASSGAGQAFTFVYSDTVFAQSLTTVAFLFNSSLTFTNACYVVYDRVANTVALEADNGLSSTSMPLNSASTLQNSQCTINTASAAQSGLSIVFSITVGFKGAFTGTQNIFMYAAAGALNTGWVVKGTYVVANGGVPVAASVVPASGAGPGERFSFTITDQGGSGFLNGAGILFASSFNLVNACYLVWDGNGNTISLAFDNPANGQTSFTPGAAGIAANSQCTVSATNSTVLRTATQVIITLDVAFAATFVGTKNIYLYAAEALANSGWTTVGTWAVTGGGLAQSISFGALGNVTFGVAPFGIAATATSGLAVSLSSTTPPTCGVSGGTVTILGAGNCSITASQAGNRNYAAATPVVQSFMVNAIIAPTGVNPASGSGITQTFTFNFTDPAGYADLAVMDIIINDFLDGQNGCYFALAAVTGSTGYIYLVNDFGSGGYAPGSPMFFPSSGILQNSQCSINAAGTSVSASGNALTLTVAITFASSFAGNKIFFMAARSDTQNSGWQALGTWNVPGAPPTGPAVGGVSPGRSTTTSQTYTFTFTDTNGYSDLTVLDILTNSFLDGAAACYMAYVPSGATTGYLYLVDDFGPGGYAPGSPMLLSSGGTLQNSQCTISMAGSSASASGNTLSVSLAITFKNAFAGNQVFYLAARNNGAGNSGWQAAGSVTVP